MKMRHQLDFADSLRREPSVVLGLLLRPYSIGMELELLRARSPFVTSQKFSEVAELPGETKLAALIFAVDVCSQSEAERDESNRILNGKFRWHQFSDQRKQKRIGKIWDDWNLIVAKLKHDEELQKFWNYLCAGKTGPEFAPPEGDEPGTPVGAPEMCSLLHYIRSLPPARLAKYGCDLDFPVAIARYEYYTMLESQGKVALKADSAETLADFAAEMEAKVASGEVVLPTEKPAETTQKQEETE